MGLLKKLERSRAVRALRGGKAAPAPKRNGNGAAKRREAAKSGGGLHLAMSAKDARTASRVLEQVGFQLTGEAAMIEAGTTRGTPTEARRLRKEAKVIADLRAALDNAI